MVEPIITLAASEILKLAFDEFIKSSSGEVAKKLTSEALNKARELRYKIVSWFKDKQDVKAEKAIIEIQDHGSLEALNELTAYLNDAMEKDPAFTQGIRQFAQQINNIQSQNTSNRQYNSYGRDMINIEHIQGNPRIGGSQS